MNYKYFKNCKYKQSESKFRVFYYKNMLTRIIHWFFVIDQLVENPGYRSPSFFYHRIHQLTQIYFHRKEMIAELKKCFVLRKNQIRLAFFFRQLHPSFGFIINRQNSFFNGLTECSKFFVIATGSV